MANPGVRRLKRMVDGVLLPTGLFGFLRTLPANPRILDIGCGNSSPQRMKWQRPDANYTGIDVGDYNQTTESLGIADRYITVTSAEFAPTIAGLGAAQFDAVISNHNLEHCEAPDAVLAAAAKVLAPGGKLFLAFPSEESVNFPSRTGTLNFYDDPTHRVVPQWDHVTAQLRSLDLDIRKSARRYRPVLPVMVGLAFEPWSDRTKKLAPWAGTWALYGFESILWAEKRAQS